MSLCWHQVPKGCRLLAHPGGNLLYVCVVIVQRNSDLFQLVSTELRRAASRAA